MFINSAHWHHWILSNVHLKIYSTQHTLISCHLPRASVFFFGYFSFHKWGNSYANYTKKKNEIELDVA